MASQLAGGASQLAGGDFGLFGSLALCGSCLLPLDLVAIVFFFIIVLVLNLILDFLVYLSSIFNLVFY